MEDALGKIIDGAESSGPGLTSDSIGDFCWILLSRAPLQFRRKTYWHRRRKDCDRNSNSNADTCWRKCSFEVGRAILRGPMKTDVAARWHPKRKWDYNFRLANSVLADPSIHDDKILEGKQDKLAIMIRKWCRSLDRFILLIIIKWNIDKIRKIWDVCREKIDCAIGLVWLTFEVKDDLFRNSVFWIYFKEVA